VFEPDAERLASLQLRGVTLERERVVAVGEEGADIILADGRIIQLAGIFTQPSTAMASPLAAQLGCEFEEGPTGAYQSLRFR